MPGSLMKYWKTSNNKNINFFFLAFFFPIVYKYHCRIVGETIMDEDKNINDMMNGNKEDEESKPGPERRNSKRFDERLFARLENEHCSVLNVSNKGVLLQTDMPVYFIPLEKSLDFELQLNGQWIRVRGKIMWIQSDVLHSKVGIYIQYAPEPYFNFLRELYE
jgi:hypothetical protein